MRVVPVSVFVFGCIGLTWFASSSPTGTNLRRSLQGSEDTSDDEGPTGFFAAIWARFFAATKPWEDRDDHDINDLGAFVYEMTIDDLQPGQQGVGEDSVHMQEISQNGLNGDKWNRYAWSSSLDNEENLWIGTFNANRNEVAAKNVQWSILKAPWGMKTEAFVEGFLRHFHGNPIFDSAGGQVFRRNDQTGDFDLMFQAPEEHVGFRSMVNHNGNIYVGSANGPNEPLNREPYDFSWYVEGQGEGAKVFTNAGGEFHMLDDQGLLDSTDKSIRKMCVSGYSNRLFVGTESHPCAKVLIYDEPTNTWKKIQQDGDNCKLAVSECQYIGDGKMLIGTWQTLGHALYVIDEKNGDAITQVETPRKWWHFSCGVMELRVFKGQLYLGLLSFPRGFALLRTSNLDILSVKEDDWETITNNGFAREQRQQLGARVAGNEYPWSSEEVNGVYVLGTMTLTQRGFSTKSSEFLGAQPQLWGTRDGENWYIIHHEDQPGFMFGYRTMQTTSDNKLFIGSASNLFELVDRETALETVDAPATVEAP